ncbi:NLP/P60 protein [uncultured delta proteobacterium]|uniref:NLP/P60 protein n=1 Tax=uncultured delta proteobacterium TaxID=34034 RepID=A0A212KBE9_9DELT|nr:NLP/P60 protein [uncultured delta proteobacterium]
MIIGERPYASRALLRAGVILLVLATLLAQGCGKTILGSSGGSRAKSGPAVAATAKTQIGKPYKYGGATPKTGFDCSGLIQWSYRQHGVSVPRLAKDQAACGKSVKKGQLQPGDIVVFRISSLAGVHTGIYSGNGKFVHSPSSGKRIREDNINEDYWKRRYVSARRVL